MFKGKIKAALDLLSDKVNAGSSQLVMEQISLYVTS